MSIEKCDGKYGLGSAHKVHIVYIYTVYTIHCIVYSVYCIVYSIYGITKNQKVWLCGQGRPDSSFAFKSCEINKIQGGLV